MPLVNKETGTTATPLTAIDEIRSRSDRYREMTDNQLLREALATSNDKCNDLISRQNTLITVLTEKVKNVSVGNEKNVNDLKESVSNAIVAMKSLQDETRTLNKTIATETSQAIKRTTTTLESELRRTIAVQSDAVFTEVKKEIDESKKLLETTREELRLQHGFRKFMFWATPILLLVQTALTAFLLLK